MNGPSAPEVHLFLKGALDQFLEVCEEPHFTFRHFNNWLRDALARAFPDHIQLMLVVSDGGEDAKEYHHVLKIEDMKVSGDEYMAWNTYMESTERYMQERVAEGVEVEVFAHPMKPDAPAMTLPWHCDVQRFFEAWKAQWQGQHLHQATPQAAKVGMGKRL